MIEIRASTVDDAHHVDSLIGNEVHIFKKRFQGFDIIQCIEHGILSLTAIDAKASDGTVVGFASFWDRPALCQGITSGLWESALMLRVNTTQLTATNTLFMVFFVAEHMREYDILEQIVTAAFQVAPEVDYLVVMLPKEVPLYQPLDALFEVLKAEEIGGPLSQQYSGFVCQRGLNGTGKLTIRQARVEDHDDLLPIFHSHHALKAPGLSSEQESFYLARLIESQNADHKALTAEVNGRAVGIMGISRSVDMETLLANYELLPYGNLVKRRPSSAEDKGGTNAVSGKSHDELRVRSAHGTLKPASPSGTAKESTPGDKREVASSTSRSQLATPARTLPGSSSAAAGSAGEAARKTGKQDEQQPADQTRETPLHELLATEPNAFCVRFYCLDPQYVARAGDFLSQAFSAFPDRDYMVLLVPSASTERTLQHWFAYVPPRHMATLPTAMYLLHRDAVSKTVEVRPVSGVNAAAVEACVRTLEKDKAREVLDDIAASSASDSSLRAFAVVASETRTAARQHSDHSGSPSIHSEEVVGVVLLQTSVNAEFLRAEFEIEDFVVFNQHKSGHHAEIRQFYLNPQYAAKKRTVLKEVMRCSNTSCIYYKLGTSPRSPPPILNLMTEMVHVRPRRTVVRHEEASSPKDADLFGLFFFTSKLVYAAKSAVTTRIVVVGASDVGLGFLERISFISNLHFYHVVVISPGGMPTGTSLFLPTSHCFSTKKRRKMALDKIVRVVDAKMVGIDRVNKLVYTSHRTVIAYDFLILAAGRQDQALRNVEIRLPGTVQRTPRNSSGRVHLRGAFALHNEQSARLIADYVVRHGLTGAAGQPTSDHRGTAIVVYGSTLEAYTTLYALLQLGVAGSQLFLVLPPSTSEQTCFNDHHIDEKVAAELDAAGVTVFKDRMLVGLEGDEEGFLTVASFQTFVKRSELGTTPSETLDLYCNMLISCAQKEVDLDTFHAVNDSCLVYDGRLVVDNHFRTNDPAMCVTLATQTSNRNQIDRNRFYSFAAGGLTKYSRKFSHMLAGALPLEYYNSREVGTKLADIFLMYLRSNSTTAPTDTALQRFEEPKSRGGTVPGGYRYLHTERPANARLPTMAATMTKLDNGRDIATQTGKGYMRFHVAASGTIEGVTYFGKEAIEEDNLLSLVGVPDTALNQLGARFDEGIVPDLVAFLRQAWAQAIFYDRFVEFRVGLREWFMREAGEWPAIESKLAEWAKKHEGDGPRVAELARLLGHATTRAIEQAVILFLRENHRDLAMYYVPTTLPGPHSPAQ